LFKFWFFSTYFEIEDKAEHFKILDSDVIRILNKMKPKSEQFVSYDMKIKDNNCVPKSYLLAKNQDFFSYFSIAFEFSFEVLMTKINDSAITALHILKIFIPQVMETLNFLWKNTCD